MEKLGNTQPLKLNIFLGGTYVHNSKTFLAEVSHIRNESEAFEME